MSNFKELIEAATIKGAESWDERNHQESDYYCTASFKAGCKLPNELLLKACEALEFLVGGEPMNGSEGKACTFCDMGAAGYSKDGEGHHDSIKHICPVHKASEALNEIRKALESMK